MQRSARSAQYVRHLRTATLHKRHKALQLACTDQTSQYLMLHSIHGSMCGLGLGSTINMMICLFIIIPINRETSSSTNTSAALTRKRISP
jgi:hypothetical protein